MPRDPSRRFDGEFPDVPQFLALPEAAEFIGVSRQALTANVRFGLWRCVHQAGGRQFLLVSAEETIEKMQAAGLPVPEELRARATAEHVDHGFEPAPIEVSEGSVPIRCDTCGRVGAMNYNPNPSRRATGMRAHIRHAHAGVDVESYSVVVAA